MEKFFYTIVGNHTNTNDGVGRFLLAIVTFILIGGGAFWSLGSTNPPLDTVLCDPVKGDPAGTLAEWSVRGVIVNIRRSETNAVVEVRTPRWEPIDATDKMLIGISAYCIARGPDLRGSATIEGSGLEKLGTVIDGTWMR